MARAEKNDCLTCKTRCPCLISWCTLNRNREQFFGDECLPDYTYSHKLFSILNFTTIIIFRCDGSNTQYFGWGSKISRSTLLTFFFKIFWRTWVLFVGPLITLFWTSCDVSPGFQSQGGSLTCVLSRCQLWKWTISWKKKTLNVQELRNDRVLSSSVQLIAFVYYLLITWCNFRNLHY